MTFEKKTDIVRDLKETHVSLWKSLPNLKKQFTLLPLSQIKRNLEVKPLYKWDFNWYHFCSGEIRL